MTFIVGFAVLAAVLGVTVLVAMLFRTVVPANEVHIVQSSNKTTSYGKDTSNGNVYYNWPASLPILGVTTSALPVSVFELSIKEYEAYDVGRVPFVVDITSFFRVADTNLAAQRISSPTELRQQLQAIVQGAARSILASSDIEEIMEARSTFGEKFTNEVKTQLKEWGVETVKNIELMDIRDSDGDVVIRNIMEKKKSLIEKESREAVAINRKEARIKEIEADREVAIQDQQAREAVGLRTVEQEKAVALANESKYQTVKEQERLTKQKEMAVLQVQEVEQANILKQVQIVKAQESKETLVIQSEADKATRVIVAEGEFESAKLNAAAALELKEKEATGIQLEGAAKADASEKMKLASVADQIRLAEEIGENDGYQNYLISIRKVEADEAIGIKQAEAVEAGLTAADVKIISNTDTPNNGLNNVSDIFTSRGGMQLGAMLEGFKNTEMGSAALKLAGMEDEEKDN